MVCDFWEMITFAGMKLARFLKMHGIGNDYIYFTEYPCHPDRLPELARRLSDRHCGIGGDGVILVLPSAVADFKMRIFNADGSEARMCGNGSRCVGKLVADSGMTDKPVITLETLGGIKTLRLHRGADSLVDSVTVDMGRAKVGEPLAMETSAGRLTVTPVDMGNPHAVIFLDSEPDDFDVHTVGREIEMSPLWPDRANVEFARVTGPGRIRVRVWERGSGETMACGTGACATAAAAMVLRLTGGCTETEVELRGGRLIVGIEPDTMEVTMTGPAVTSFEGSVKLDL